METTRLSTQNHRINHIIHRLIHRYPPRKCAKSRNSVHLSTYPPTKVPTYPPSGGLQDGYVVSCKMMRNKMAFDQKNNGVSSKNARNHDGNDENADICYPPVQNSVHRRSHPRETVDNSVHNANSPFFTSSYPSFFPASRAVLRNRFSSSADPGSAETTGIILPSPV